MQSGGEAEKGLGLTNTERLIHHIVVMWDESDHVSRRRSSQLANIFWRHYVKAFPSGGKTSESPAVMYTRSPLFTLERLRTFLHQGQFVPFSGKYKDLAIVKFCSTGLIDQDERSHFVLDDVRYHRFAKGHPPMHADAAAIVAFVTSDQGQEMWEALSYATNPSTPTRTSFFGIKTAKHLGAGDQRMAYAGEILGKILSERFVRIEKGALRLNLQTEGAHSSLR